MSEPKRYHLYAGLECQAFTKAEAVLKFSEEDDGIWVKWEDYARLKAEVEAVRQEYSDATNHYNRLHNDLQAEVERLTKAGDAMAEEFSFIGSPDGGFNSIDQWNAAKEGKGQP
jgi:hypothetical protein